jgi:hypothetical protein
MNNYNTQPNTNLYSASPNYSNSNFYSQGLTDDLNIYPNSLKIEDILDNLFTQETQRYNTNLNFTPDSHTSGLGCLDSSNILNKNITSYSFSSESKEQSYLKTDTKELDKTPLNMQKSYYKNMLIMLSSPQRAKELNGTVDTIGKNDLISEFERVDIERYNSKRRLEFNNDNLKRIYEHLNN